MLEALLGEGGRACANVGILAEVTIPAASPPGLEPWLAHLRQPWGDRCGALQGEATDSLGEGPGRKDLGRYQVAWGGDWSVLEARVEWARFHDPLLDLGKGSLVACLREWADVASRRSERVGAQFPC